MWLTPVHRTDRRKKTGVSGRSRVGEESFPVGGDQVIDLTCRIDKDTLQQIRQVGLRVNRIALAGSDQAVKDGGAVSTCVTSRKKKVFSVMQSSA